VVFREICPILRSRCMCRMPIHSMEVMPRAASGMAGLVQGGWCGDTGTLSFGSQSTFVFPTFHSRAEKKRPNGEKQGPSTRNMGHGHGHGV